MGTAGIITPKLAHDAARPAGASQEAIDDWQDELDVASISVCEAGRARCVEGVNEHQRARELSRHRDDGIQDKGFGTVHADLARDVCEHMAERLYPFLEVIVASIRGAAVRIPRGGDAIDGPAEHLGREGKEALVRTWARQRRRDCDGLPRPVSASTQFSAER